MHTPTPAVFDHDLSVRLDGTLIELEEGQPSRISRTWLRWHRRRLERDIPVMVGETVCDE